MNFDHLFSASFQLRYFNDVSAEFESLFDDNGILELTIYHGVFAEWLFKNKRNKSQLTRASFDALEHRLMKQFFFRAINDLAEVVAYADLRDKEGLDPRIVNLLKDARSIVSVLTSLMTVTKQYKPDRFGSVEVPSQKQQQPVKVAEPQQKPKKRFGREGGRKKSVERSKSIQPEAAPSAAAPTALDTNHRLRLPTEIIEQVVLHLTLVNKPWSAFAGKALYKRLKLEDIGPLLNFAIPAYTARVWVSQEQFSTLSMLETSSYIQELEISCEDQSGAWNAVLITLFLFPNLQRLGLKQLQSFDALYPLFEQNLPSLQKLSVQAFAGYRRNQYWLWQGRQGYDKHREQATAFFSQLKTVEFHLCSLVFNNGGACPQFVDTAHENLRSITFPLYAPEHIAREFFAKCSAKLVALDMRYTRLSRETIQMITTTFTNLRAFAFESDWRVDVDGIVHLIQTRRPAFQCLILASDTILDGSIPRQIMRSVITHCRSLEALCLSSQGEEFEANSLQVISILGGRLKYLQLGKSIFNTHANTLIDYVAANCPNLERFDIPSNGKLHQPPLPQQEQQEADPEEDEQFQPQSQPQQQSGGANNNWWQGMRYDRKRLQSFCSNVRNLSIWSFLENLTGRDVCGKGREGGRREKAKMGTGDEDKMEEVEESDGDGIRRNSRRIAMDVDEMGISDLKFLLLVGDFWLG
ncbi:hypothetical protein HK102_000898, partial [Quaeritorhiza haematococci]